MNARVIFEGREYDAIIHATAPDGTVSATVFLENAGTPVTYRMGLRLANVVPPPVGVEDEVPAAPPPVIPMSTYMGIPGYLPQGVIAGVNDPESLKRAVPTGGGGKTNVFGAKRMKSVSLRGGNVFRSTDIQAGRGQMDESALARMAPAGGWLPGQHPPRVFSKANGAQKEVTPASFKRGSSPQSEAEVLDAIMGPPPQAPQASQTAPQVPQAAPGTFDPFASATLPSAPQSPTVSNGAPISNGSQPR
jgi:hypothetical protein